MKSKCDISLSKILHKNIFFVKYPYIFNIYNIICTCCLSASPTIRVYEKSKFPSRIYTYDDNRRLRRWILHIEISTRSANHVLTSSEIYRHWNTRAVLKGLVNRNRGTNYYVVLQCTGHYASAINYTRAFSDCAASCCNEPRTRSERNALTRLSSR